jgi:UDP-N-acetylglucosamine 2-epimerase (non-hydrolysing)
LIHLLKHSKLVLTDSGGIQEEATGLGVPTLVLREVTERPEGVEAGVLKLVGTDSERIFQETRHLLEDQDAYVGMAHAANPFGDGHAAERIVQAVLDYKEPERSSLS